ncbi:MAG: thiamine diphosphokinase [Acetatifactor sp.]|nr:thiamine diphosphokinase [Acetatifactor sp.]
MERKCFIIGAGDLTVGALEVGESDLVIAVDGGLGYCSVLGVEPDLILGDFDSVSPEETKALERLEQQIPERVIRLPREKDDTDTLAALKEGLHRGYRNFRIYGGTGGRFDHTFANIQCLLFLKKQDAVGYLVDGNRMILVLEDETVEFQKGLEGILSLFSLSQESLGVTIKGMKYPLDRAVLRNDYPVGISNEFTSEQAVISVEKGQLVCMLQWYCGQEL